MADKSRKIIDIQDAAKTTPSTTSRPIVVTNRPVLNNDPMMTESSNATAESKPAEPTTRTAKTITPLTVDLPIAEVDGDGTSSEPETAEESLSADSTAVLQPTPSTEAELAAAVPSVAEEVAEPIIARSRDAAAESQADEAKMAAEFEANVAREDELENLIESGKYNAPIKTPHGKRSRLLVVLLCIVVFLLAIAIADAALDASLITNNSLPHTNILKDK